jgi:hypothetical protein
VLEEDKKMEQKLAEAKMKREEWIIAYRTNLMRKEVDNMSVINHDYKLAQWREDLDTGHGQTVDQAATSSGHRLDGRPVGRLNNLQRLQV